MYGHVANYYTRSSYNVICFSVFGKKLSIKKKNIYTHHLIFIAARSNGFIPICLMTRLITPNHYLEFFKS